MKANNLKIGDKLICINSEYGEGFLAKGAVYTIIQIASLRTHHLTVDLKGDKSGIHWNIDRFIALNENDPIEAIMHRMGY